MKAVFLVSAKADMAELRRYLTRRFGVQTWRNTRHVIQKAIRDTLVFPQRGNVPDELLVTGWTQYRQVLVGINRIIYEVRGKTLYIHIVCDARRDLRALLLRRLLRT